MIITGNLVSHATIICILAMLLCLGSRASSEYESRETSLNSGSNDGSCIEGKCIKRTTQDIASGMWFGPRLGRRRRSDEKQEVSPEIEVLANALDGVHWAVITIPANDKRQSQFTPRLGRGSGEDLSYRDAYEIDEDDYLLPPIFTSRLGRRLPWMTSPRLGRQLRNVLRKL